MLNLVKRAFISPVENRLRAGWRLLAQTSLMMVISTCVFTPLLFFEALSLTSSSLFFLQIVEFFGVTLSVILSRRFLDKRSFSSLGLQISRRAVLDLLSGMGIAFLMMGLVTVISYGMGWLIVTGYAWEKDSLPTVLFQALMTLLVFVLVGWNEELLSRGYHLQNLASGLNNFWAVVLSSMFFGGLHLTNPNATLFGAAGVFLAGVFLSYGYLRSGQLWLSIGLHIGWNVFEGLVFGFPVSGLETYKLIRISVDGPEIWTGGLFGPEAGLVVIPALALGAVLVYAYTLNHREYGKTQSVVDPTARPVHRIDHTSHE